MTDAGTVPPGDSQPSDSEQPRTPRPRVSQPKQNLKPVTAAKRLGIYLPAAPESFREATSISRAELARLESDPPAWLEELRREGPHPREVVAARLGVSIAGLVRSAAGDALSTGQIEELREDPPAWLVRERASLARVRAEEERAATEQARRDRRGGEGR